MCESQGVQAATRLERGWVAALESIGKELHLSLFFTQARNMLVKIEDDNSSEENVRHSREVCHLKQLACGMPIREVDQGHQLTSAQALGQMQLSVK